MRTTEQLYTLVSMARVQSYEIHSSVSHEYSPKNGPFPTLYIIIKRMFDVINRLSISVVSNQIMTSQSSEFSSALVIRCPLHCLRLKSINLTQRKALQLPLAIISSIVTVATSSAKQSLFKQTVMNNERITLNGCPLVELGQLQELCNRHTYYRLYTSPVNRMHWQLATAVLVVLDVSPLELCVLCFA